MPTFKVADLTEDLELLTQARDDASEILSADRRLTAPKHSALRRALAQRYADRISLIDVA